MTNEHNKIIIIIIIIINNAIVNILDIFLKIIIIYFRR